jgi:hypothetical protein
LTDAQWDAALADGAAMTLAEAVAAVAALSTSGGRGSRA